MKMQEIVGEPVEWRLEHVFRQGGCQLRDGHGCALIVERAFSEPARLALTVNIDCNRAKSEVRITPEISLFYISIGDTGVGQQFS